MDSGLPSDVDAGPPSELDAAPSGETGFEQLRIETGSSPDIYPVGADIGDVDGDGVMDLAVTSSYSVGGDTVGASEMNVLRGDGTGGFLPPLGPYDIGSGELTPQLADVDSDGREDVILNRVIELSGIDGAPQRRIQMPLTNFRHSWGNVNADENIDFLASGYSVFAGLARGDGTFEEPVESANDVWTPLIRDLEIVDVDGDGAPDLIGLYYPHEGDGSGLALLDATLRLRLGDSRGNFAPSEDLVVPEGIVHMATGDFNRDGRADLVLSKPGGVVDVRLRHASGWAPAREIAAEDRERYPTHVGNPVVVADLDGDMALDIVAGIRLGENAPPVAALLGDGNGNFELSPSTFDAAPILAYFLAAGDLNADGRDDIVVLYTQDVGAVTVWQSR